MKPRVFIYSLLILLASCSKDLEVSEPNTPIGNFEALWKTIDTKYCFVEEKGISWDEVYAKYRPSVDTLKQQQLRELFDVFADMLDCLHDGHVNLYSPFDISRSRSWWEGYPNNYNSQLLYSDQYLGSDYKTASGLVYNRIANDSIGYIRYSSFSSGFSALNMYYVLSYFSQCKGLILDVRNNGGGDLENAYKLAATFFADNRIVGYWHHKTGEGHQDFSEMKPIEIDTLDMPVRWLRPTVVLCNRQSYSATNSFVNAMRYADNCLIVGGKTGGGGGMPLSYELPNGWLLRFSAVKMYDAEKISIEEGIEPDVEVTLVSEEKDDLIEYAIKAIL